MSQPDFLGGGDDPPQGGMNGVAVGVVTNNEDPKNIGRVKVKFPWRDADDESFWARIATNMTGKGYGTYFLPEVGDEVLVAFEDGDIHHPYVVGSLWNGKDKPPKKNKDGKNDIREIKSRKGHVLDFNDSKKEAKVKIETDAGHTVVLDDTKGSEKIKMKDKSGNEVVLDSTKDAITVSAKKKISLDAKTIELNGGQKVKIKGKQQVKVSGGKVQVSGSMNLKLKSNGMMKIQSTAQLTIKGVIVRIN